MALEHDVRALQEAVKELIKKADMKQELKRKLRPLYETPGPAGKTNTDHQMKDAVKKLGLVKED
jgi:hypothetical protein